MGADFLCSVCPLPVLSETAQDEGLRRILDERISNINLARCIGLLKGYHHDHEEEISERITGLSEEHLFELPDIRSYFAQEIMKEMIQGALDEIIYFKDRRDICHVLLDHKWWIISGGMSWGDSPTEAMSSIDLLDASGILEGLNTDHNKQL
jgi:hypothetical protein